MRARRRALRRASASSRPCGRSPRPRSERAHCSRRCEAGEHLSRDGALPLREQGRADPRGRGIQPSLLDPSDGRHRVRSGTPEEKLEHVIVWMAEPATTDVMRVHRQLLAQSEWNERLRSSMAAEYMRWRETYVELFRRLKDAGPLDPAVDEHLFGAGFRRWRTTSWASSGWTHRSQPKRSCARCSGPCSAPGHRYQATDQAEGAATLRRRCSRPLSIGRPDNTRGSAPRWSRRWDRIECRHASVHRRAEYGRAERTDQAQDRHCVRFLSHSFVLSVSGA